MADGTPTPTVPATTTRILTNAIGLALLGVDAGGFCRVVAGQPGGPATLDPTTGKLPVSQTDATIAATPAALTALTTRVTAVEAVQTAGMIGKDTLAHLNADLAHADSTLALVTNDATLANNTTYIKSGASGSGSWIASADRISTLNTRLTTDELNLTLLNGLYGVETIGRPVASPPITGSALSTATYVLATPYVNNGIITTIRMWGLGSANLTVRVFSKSGTTFTQVGADTVVAMVSGLNTKTVNIPVTAGQYIGFFVPATLLARNVPPVDSGGWYTGAGNVTTFTSATPSTTLRLEIGFDSNFVAATSAQMTTVLGNITSNQASIADNLIRLNALPTDSQTIGRPVAPITGLSTSLGTYVLGDPVIADGVIRSVRVFSLGAATIKIKRFTNANYVFTQVGSDTSLTLVAGLNTFSVSIPVSRGDYLAFYTPATAVPRVATTSDSGGYYSTGSDSAGFTGLTAPIASNQFQIGLDVTFNSVRPIVIDIHKSDRITVLGDSHTESDYTPAGKSWISKISSFSDFCFDSFAKSGDKISDNLVRLRAATLTLGTLPYANRGTTYALIYCGQNDAAAVTLPTFLENMRQAIETVRSLGAIPIISTQHTDTYGIGSQAIFRNLAEQQGAYFIDVTPNCRNMDFGTRYNNFWNGTHMAVRTNETIIPPIEAFLRTLQVSQSIKIFRKRANVTVSTVADLLFDTHYDRRKLFDEILIGQGAIATANENLLDEVPSIGAPQIQLINSEYETLQNGNSIALADYSLIDVVFPTLGRNIRMATLVLSDPTATVYVRNILGTLTTGLPVGAWVQVYGSYGRFSLSNSQLRTAMRVDKLSFLIVKSGGIAAFTQPRIEWYGDPIAKPIKPRRTEGPAATGAELLAATDLVTTTGWTVLGSLSAGTPGDGCLPRNSTGRVTITNTNYLSQALTYTQSNSDDREIEIRVRCRYFPAIVVSTNPYPSGAAINHDSFDYGLLTIEVQTAAGAAPYIDRVGLWWKDVILRTTASMLTTGFTINIKSDGTPLEVAYVSAKFVNA